MYILLVVEVLEKSVIIGIYNSNKRFQALRQFYSLYL